jgi:hypothetical protein
MTHDELLAICDNYSFKDSIEPVKALRAIVELHKPIEEDGKLWCKHESCYNHIEFLERNDCDCSYPCPTIQAILKEMN